MQLSQSEWIAVAILAGFLIYLSIKGKLATYWSLLTGGAAAGSSATSTASSSPAATAGAQVGAIAGAAAGPAAAALPGVTSGTVTQGQQTTQQYFPNIPGVNLADPMSMVTF